MGIGERIRMKRRTAGLSQEALARKTHVTMKAIGEIERGEVSDPHISSLQEIASALGVSVAWLIGEDPETAPKAEAARPRSTESRRLSMGKPRKAAPAFRYKRKPRRRRT